ncbi:MAG: hypothetical protein ACP6IY_10195 [Promethearchaeia archaeon]
MTRKTKVFVIKRKENESNQQVVIRTLKLARLKEIVNNSEKDILINYCLPELGNC